MTNLGGRPTLYSEEILEKTQSYLEECKDEEIPEVVGLSAKGTELYKNKLRVNLPTIQGLSSYLKVNQDTLYEWAKVHPEFSETLANIKAEQAKRLMNSGLSGDYNPTIAKLMLSSNHGMREGTDITTGGNPINKEDIELANKLLGDEV